MTPLIRRDVVAAATLLAPRVEATLTGAVPDGNGTARIPRVINTAAPAAGELA